MAQLGEGDFLSSVSFTYLGNTFFYEIINKDEEIRQSFASQIHMIDDSECATRIVIILDLNYYNYHFGINFFLA